jgi:hypothetical protein
MATKKKSDPLLTLLIVLLMFGACNIGPCASFCHPRQRHYWEGR